jgi:hypothetical protein
MAQICAHGERNRAASRTTSRRCCIVMALPGTPAVTAGAQHPAPIPTESTTILAFKFADGVLVAEIAAPPQEISSSTIAPTKF